MSTPDFTIEHTVDEYGEDRWLVTDANGDWIGDSHPTKELAIEAAPRELAEYAERKA